MDYSKLIGTNSNAAVPPAKHVLLTADTHRRHLRGTRALMPWEKSLRLFMIIATSIVQGAQDQVLSIINVGSQSHLQKDAPRTLARTFKQTSPKGAQATYCRGKILVIIAKRCTGSSRSGQQHGRTIPLRPLQHNHHKSHLKRRHGSSPEHSDKRHLKRHRQRIAVGRLVIIAKRYTSTYRCKSRSRKGCASNIIITSPTLKRRHESSPEHSTQTSPKGTQATYCRGKSINSCDRYQKAVERHCGASLS